MVCNLSKPIRIVPIRRVDEPRRFKEEMIVIVHQAVGMAEPSIAIDDMGEQGETLRPVAVVHHNVLPGICPDR